MRTTPFLPRAVQYFTGAPFPRPPQHLFAFQAVFILREEAGELSGWKAHPILWQSSQLEK